MQIEDRPHEECGVIGIFAPNEDVARMAFFGLYALQHRGQEAAGMAVSDGRTMRLHKEVGLVSQVFTPEALAPMHGHYAIGHTRYSTTGSSLARNAQPFMIETLYGPIAVAHNGNLINSSELRQELLRQRGGLAGIIGYRGDHPDAGGSRRLDLDGAHPRRDGQVEGRVLAGDSDPDGVFAVRDPWGFRPLSVGILPSGGHVVRLETGALRTLGCQAIREVQPGEIVSLSNNALTVQQAIPPQNPLARCTFEHIYFSRPDSSGTGAACTRCASVWARSWLTRPAWLRMWSSRCRIRPSRLRLVTRRLKHSL